LIYWSQFMEFKYTRHNLSKKEQLLERFLELIPGGLSWLILIGMTVLSFTKPIAASVIIIAFILFWFIKMVYMNMLLILSYTRFNVERNTNWLGRTEEIDKLDFSQKDIPDFPKPSGWRSRISLEIHKYHLKRLLKSGSVPPKSKHIYHAVIMPVVKEEQDVVEPGIIAIKNGSYPAKRIILTIALEERAAQNIKEQMFNLRDKYKDAFLEFFVILHPSDLPGEARVKGANTTYAAHKVEHYLNEQRIPFENVIISCFDADTVPVADYFSCLAYYFMITPKRTRSSYQPIPVYFNNIWDVPGFARILDVGSSFFQFVEATDPKKLITFSSHSSSFKALADMDYWPTDIISDDSAIFWKALLFYKGDYHTVPMPIAVSMDVIAGRNRRETFVNIYKQKRRWAWGVENFPIVTRGFIHTSGFSLSKKIYYTVRSINKFATWATWSFVLAFISWFPVLAAGKEFASTTVYYIAPRIRFIIFLLAGVGIVTCMVTSMILLPRKKTKHPLFKKFLHAGEWLLIPFVVIFLSSLPALDAQTRLMFGKYMEFWVTDKYRKK